MPPTAPLSPYPLNDVKFAGFSQTEKFAGVRENYVDSPPRGLTKSVDIKESMMSLDVPVAKYNGDLSRDTDRSMRGIVMDFSGELKKQFAKGGVNPVLYNIHWTDKNGKRQSENSYGNFSVLTNEQLLNVVQKANPDSKIHLNYKFELTQEALKEAIMKRVDTKLSMDTVRSAATVRAMELTENEVYFMKQLDDTELRERRLTKEMVAAAKPMPADRLDERAKETSAIHAALEPKVVKAVVEFSKGVAMDDFVRQTLPSPFNKAS